MVAGFLHKIRHHVFKGQHPLDVEVARAGDEILLVGILPGELVADEMTAVVQVFSVPEVVLDRYPAGRLDRSDAAPVGIGHQVAPD